MKKETLNVIANLTQKIPKDLHPFGSKFGSEREDNSDILIFKKDKLYVANVMNDYEISALGEDGIEYKIGGDGDITAYLNDKRFFANFRILEDKPITCIETDVWEANPENEGLLKFVRRKTISEVYNQTEQFLKEQGIYHELDYFAISGMNTDTNKEFPKWRDIACYAVVGGNEGHYILIEAITVDRGERVPIFTGKTFMGMCHALTVSNALTKAFYDEMI